MEAEEEQMGSFCGKVEAVEIFWALIVSLERLGSCDGGGVRVHDVCQTNANRPPSPIRSADY